MLYTIVAVLVLVLDQAVKFWTTKNIPLEAVGDQCVTLIPGVLHMTNVENPGAAFSILANQRLLLIAVSALFVIGIIVLINMEVIRSRFGRWMAVLVMAGALGNCIDRALYGYVVDMFEFELFSFAVFNVADIFITVCGILFCLHVIFYRDPDAVAEKEPAQPRRRTRQPRRSELDYDDEPAPQRRPRPQRRPEAEEDEEAPAPRQRAPQQRRPRPARPKEDLYANIPHRGEHRPLSDELRPQDPADPFAEWEFGDVVEPAPKAAPRRAPRDEDDLSLTPRPKKSAPQPTQDEGDFDLDLDRAAARQAAKKEAEARAAAEKAAAQKTQDAAPKKAAPAQDAGPEEFSLDDILAEFRDI